MNPLRKSFALYYIVFSFLGVYKTKFDFLELTGD